MTESTWWYIAFFVTNAFAVYALSAAGRQMLSEYRASRACLASRVSRGAGPYRTTSCSCDCRRCGRVRDVLDAVH